LALTKELVELHKGIISAESKEGEGTTIKLLIPLGKEHLKRGEIVKKENQGETKTIEKLLNIISGIDLPKEKSAIKNY
jgi:hypothetical protein